MIKRGDGLTDSEKYLKFLCDKTFLSLWGYPNVFRQPGSELCDLLIVFGDDIIIFSDKHCRFPNSGDLALDWKRWFRRVVAKSAGQLWGAENWIKNQPGRIFVDDKCKHSLPIPISITERTKIHLVLVSHGASEMCVEICGGSGSLVYFNEINGINNHTFPFQIGDIDNKRTFIHVLDDNSLNILMKNRDTVADFTAYLTKREQFLRSGLTIFSAGEEELLSHYLKNLNREGDHDFVVPSNLEMGTGLAFEEGLWTKFQKSEQRILQLQADKKSYIWDNLNRRI